MTDRSAETQHDVLKAESIRLIKHLQAAIMLLEGEVLTNKDLPEVCPRLNQICEELQTNINKL
jgi:hypothetical protein